MGKNVVELYSHQETFLFSPEFITALIGGIGSGKTWSGAHYVLKRLQENPETMGFIGANTVKQLHDATLKTLFEECDKFGIKYHHKPLDGYVIFPQFTYKVGDAVKHAIIKVASLENFNSIRGIEIGWAWLDETRDTKEEAFDVILGRLRCKKSNKLEIRITTSPSGYNWLFDRLVGKNKSDDSKVIHASTRDNKSLPESYIKSLEDKYDSKFAQQELEGKFINLTSGKVYHAFDRKIHVQEKKIYNLPTRFGVDFNVGNMTAVCAQMHGTSIHIFKEYYGLQNTFALAAQMDKDFQGRGSVVPDSTGKAKKSSSKKSDHQILKDRGFDILKQRNPFIEDRWNAVNKVLQDCRLTIDPSCVNIIEELERADLEKASSNEGKHFHISVALGYLVYKYFPYSVRRNRQSRVLTW